jgi:hypothetical protein
MLWHGQVLCSDNHIGAQSTAHQLPRTDLWLAPARPAAWDHAVMGEVHCLSGHTLESLEAE